jgi:EAL domain-containing protein (putative c-di-GMP-specific phosphodiesterase class I)/CheY-like chemotaxis protein/GGDEF domain-containing protein
MSTSERAAILCVDDEPRLLEALSRLLSRHYETLTAGSGEAALDVLAQHPQVAVIISDMRMPGMDGATFLARSRASAPDAQRIMLTGHADPAATIAAINDGQICQFLEKPCAPAKLLATVGKAVEAYQARALEHTNVRRKIEYKQLRIDPATGLPSRLRLMEVLESEARAQALPGSLVVFYVAVSGAEGSDAELTPGDEWLATVAERLRSHCHSAALVSCPSPGLFVVMYTHLSESDTELLARGRSLGASLREPAAGSSAPAPLDISIGIARLTDPDGWASLINCAALAAQEARRDDALRVCLFRPEIRLDAQRNQELLRALHLAPERGELYLNYQPIVDVSAARVHSLECLVRWKNGALGEVSPGAFIPLAEQSGAIVALGHWILARACREGAGLLEAGNLKLAVNVSAKELTQPGFLEQVDRCLRDSDLPPRALELELTESALAHDVQRLGEVLEHLRRMHVSIAVDDFGTGYSSLAYLSQLPIDLIKVDRVFVRDFQRGGRAIIKAAVDIGRELGREVIVEGIETAEMLQAVRALGVSLIQGFWFARPMPAGQVREWMTNYQRGDTAPSPVPQGAATPERAIGTANG